MDMDLAVGISGASVLPVYIPRQYIPWQREQGIM